MSTLESLVTQALGDIPEGPDLSPREIIENRMTLSPLALAEKITEGIQAIESDPQVSRQITSEILAWTAHSGNHFTSYRSSLSMLSRSTHALGLLFLAEEAQQDPQACQELCKELHGMVDALQEEERGSRQRNAVGSFQSSLSYIEELFPDDYLDVLADVSGAQRSTVKRWIAGGSAQWRNGDRVQRVAKTLYRLQDEQGWERSRVLQWFDEPLASGNSPRELWGDKGYGIPQELSAELQKHAIVP